ncbi:MAG TPA: carboxymuconolactone decarboxylase family protein [Chitinophagaceae bacterium]|nr:carboxymuconolactone decarboxylase family protein [Chitinophagaceae bacterium]
MTRLQAVNPETSAGKTKELFNGIEKKLGMVPNMMRTMGNSVAVLNGYLSFSGALGDSKIGAKLGEQIALAVAEANQCEYCLSAHSYIGDKMLGIDKDILSSSREANTGNQKADAALVFTQALVKKKGLVTDEDVNKVFAAGFSEGEVAEIVAHTALNIFTNYINNTAKTVIDFPRIELAAVI